MFANTVGPQAVVHTTRMTDEPRHGPVVTAPADVPDAELVARACANDAAAFELLVRRHYGAAYSIALAFMGNRADAEDVCHDAFVRAAARLEDCRHRDRFANWLVMIVRNHARNAIARRTVRRTSPIDHEAARSSDDVAPAVDTDEL